MHAVHLLIEQPGLQARGAGTFGQEAFEENHLAEIGGRFREGHRIRGAEQPRALERPGMPGVTDFVGQGNHILYRPVIAHIDPLLSAEQRAGAERTRPLARAGLGFDPAVVEHFTEIGAERGVGGGEGAVHHGTGLGPRNLCLPRRGNLRRFKIKKVQGCRPLESGGSPQRAARDFNVGVDRLHHGVERGRAHGGVEERCFQKTWLSPPPVKRQPCACNAVESGREGVHMIKPGLLTRVKSGGPDRAFR